MNPACSVKEYEKGKLSKMKKAVTFGEIMLRLQPPSYERFLQAKSFDAVYGGGEANVAVSLSQLGAEAKFVTRLPANPLGVACRNYLRGWGVDTSDIVFGGDRIGIYFCEKGASQRPSNVVYDRAGSSAARTRASLGVESGAEVSATSDPAETDSMSPAPAASPPSDSSCEEGTNGTD